MPCGRLGCIWDCSDHEQHLRVFSPSGLLTSSICQTFAPFKQGRGRDDVDKMSREDRQRSHTHLSTRHASNNSVACADPISGTRIGELIPRLRSFIVRAERAVSDAEDKLSPEQHKIVARDGSADVYYQLVTIHHMHPYGTVPHAANKYPGLYSPSLGVRNAALPIFDTHRLPSLHRRNGRMRDSSHGSSECSILSRRRSASREE